MNALLAASWKWLAIACFVWYAAVTAWVGFKGLLDIRRMLARLERTSGSAQSADRRETETRHGSDGDL